MRRRRRNAAAAWQTSAPQPQPMSSKRSPGCEPQLAADHVELVALRGREYRCSSREIGAGVDHLGIEEERVERIRDVVVIVHVLLVGRFAAVGPAPCRRERCSSGHGPPRGTSRNLAAVASIRRLSSVLQSRLGGRPSAGARRDRRSSRCGCRCARSPRDWRACRRSGGAPAPRRRLRRRSRWRASEAPSSAGTVEPSHSTKPTSNAKALAHMREQPPQAIEALDRPIHFRWTM